MKQLIRRRLLRGILSRVDVMFGTGQVALRVLESMGARREALVDFPFFLDLDEPARLSALPESAECALELRRSVGCERRGAVFVMLGTIVEKKGHDLGIEAFARSSARVADPVGLLIAGEGPDRSRLEQRVAELGLRHKVRFLGWKEPADMGAVFGAADVVLHPSRYDPFPVVVLEGMSWGKVIIGSDACGSVVERIRPGFNGFSFPSENIEALADVMVDVVRNPEQRKVVARAARATAEEWPMERATEIVYRAATRALRSRSG